MKGNLGEVVKYLDKMYGRFIQTVMRDPDDDEVVVVYGQDNFGNSHWRFYIYMLDCSTELEIDEGYCVDNEDIEFFNRVYQEIDTIAEIYHKRSIGFNK